MGTNNGSSSFLGRNAIRLVIAVLGVAAIVGSGGGSIGGIPPYTGPGSGSPPTPLPMITAEVRPTYATAFVGTSVTFVAEVISAPGSVTYQWSRSFDGGNTFVDIAGATGESYTLTGVGPGDDGAVFRVRIQSPPGLGWGELVWARGYLTVSATPGIVFEDSEFLAENWLASPLTETSVSSLVHAEEHVASGGNPAAFGKMTVQLPTSRVDVLYSARSALYDPATQGAILHFDYTEDCIVLQSGASIYVASNLLIEQAGRKYVSSNYRINEGVTVNDCTSKTWHELRRGVLTIEAFKLVDGPPCGASEPCPDFSATAEPIRFGYHRLVAGGSGDSVAHGIDNWKVTVWRK
jgi:hypothetical protein